MKIKALTDCTVSYPVESIMSYCMAAGAVLGTIGLAVLVIAIIRSEFF